jgi:hypothetical protein
MIVMALRTTDGNHRCNSLSAYLQRKYHRCGAPIHAWQIADLFRLVTSRQIILYDVGSP